jgi:CRP/FNR family transcriptional regulator, cyclic AMP receptor protein
MCESTHTSTEDRMKMKIIVSNIKRPHDLSIKDKCQECDLRREGFFCHLTEKDIEGFEHIKITRAYPKGTILFFEGQPARGVYMLCQGRVKLSACSPDGKIIILEIAEPGDILGLSAALNNLEYETTAEVLEPCQINYVKTSDIMRFLQNSQAASLNAARQLSRNYQTAHRQICALGLSDSVADKLAKLFLGWSSNGNGNGKSNGNGNGKSDEVHIKNFFTHEEMAEMIGASRETVTRALRSFRENDLITIRGSDLIIHDRKRLKLAIGTRLPKYNGFGTSA